MSELRDVQVVARLALPGALTRRHFELTCLRRLLAASNPQQVTLEFTQSANAGSEIDVHCAPGGPRALVAAASLREGLLRGDIAGRYDCLLPAPGHPVPHRGRMYRLEGPHDAALPGGQWFALPAPLARAAVEAIRHAQEQGFAIGYRVALTTRPALPEAARRLVPALAALGVRHRQPQLEAALQDTVAVLSSPGWSAIEAIGVLDDTACVQSADWLWPMLSRSLLQEAPFLPADFWSLETLQTAQPGATAASLSVAKLVHRARPADYLARIFEAIVPSVPGSDLVLPEPEPKAPTAGNYVFVSYAHADRTFSRSVISALHEAGVRLWFDAGIQPGATWDQDLETRLREAGAVVVCLTEQYEQSRWCTRELKFADHLRKPILPIAPAPWRWGHGLQLMFQELQVAAYDHGRGLAALRQALGTRAPQVFQ